MIKKIKSSEKILVTGATGLLGSHLIKKSKNSNDENNILALSRSGKSVHGAQGVACDILDVVTLQELMQEVDKVYHCAAVVSFHPKQKDEMNGININGTANVVNTCIDAGVKKLLYVSSVAAIGGRNNSDILINEKVKFNSKKSSFYGKTKYEAEMHVWRGFAEGLNVVVVNPSIILGAGDWDTGSTQLFKNVYEEFPYYTQGVHGYVDVEDVANAMLQLMESDISGEKFILNGANVSFKELFTMIAQAFNKKPPAKFASPLMSEIVWRLSSLKAFLKGENALLTKETARSAQEKVLYDNEKIKMALPNFEFHSLENTVNRIALELKQKYNFQ